MGIRDNICKHHVKVFKLLYCIVEETEDMMGDSPMKEDVQGEDSMEINVPELSSGVSKEARQMFVMSKEFRDLKLAPLRPLDLPWPPLLQNQTLLQKKHISLLDP